MHVDMEVNKLSVLVPTTHIEYIIVVGVLLPSAGSAFITIGRAVSSIENSGICLHMRPLVQQPFRPTPILFSIFARHRKDRTCANSIFYESHGLGSVAFVVFWWLLTIQRPRMQSGDTRERPIFCIFTWGGPNKEYPDRQGYFGNIHEEVTVYSVKV